MVKWLARQLRVWEVSGSNPGRVVPKTLKTVRAASLLGVQYLKGWSMDNLMAWHPWGEGNSSEGNVPPSAVRNAASLL